MKITPQFMVNNRQHEAEHELIVEGTQLAISRLWEKRKERAKSG
jgi:hypothetical protein